MLEPNTYLPFGIGVGSRVLERFEITKIIGASPNCVVYGVADRAREYPESALKCFSPAVSGQEDAFREFTNTLQKVKELSHANIVKVRDFGMSPAGQAYVLAENFQGIPLKHYLTQSEGRGTTLTEAIYYLYYTARALACAHRSGLIHQNLRPSKILIGKDGTLKIFDFGVQSFFFSIDEFPTQDEFAAEPYYLAPEQLLGQPPTNRTDIYSLGVLAYEMLSGQIAFFGDNFQEVKNRILEQPFPDLSKQRKSVPPFMCEFIHRATARDPQQRFGTMYEVVNFLEPYIEQNEEVAKKNYVEARDNAIHQAAFDSSPRPAILKQLPIDLSPNKLIAIAVLFLIGGLLAYQALENRKVYDSIGKQEINLQIPGARK